VYSKWINLFNVIFNIKMSIHPRRIEWFHEERSEVFDFSHEIREAIEDSKKHLIISAPVKCGKRIIVECTTLVMPEYKHIYLCSLNRKDVKKQKDELEQYGILLRCIFNDKETEEAVKEIKYLLSLGKQLIIHFDECDYGSGKKQKMSKIFQEVKNNEKIIKLYYSATPEEAVYSNLTQRNDYELLEFVPPDSYRGAQYFLDNDLVFEPENAFEKIEGRIYFTDHGKKVLQDSIKLERNIAIFRNTNRGMSGDLLKANKENLELDISRLNIDYRSITIKIVDANDSFDWEDEEVRNGYILNTGKIFIFIINQTCGRGTDLNGWHHRIACWHDCRNAKKSNLNTILQAILRPSYYITNYCRSHGVSTKKCINEGCVPEEQPIRMYVPTISMETAGTGNIQEYVNAGGKPPTRTTKGKSTAQYDICQGTYAEINHHILQSGFSGKSIEEFEKEGEFYKSGRVLGMGTSRIPNRPVTLEEAHSTMRLQYQRTNYTVIPCYMNLSNPESLTWVAIRKLTKQPNKSPIETLKSSMYH